MSAVFGNWGMSIKRRRIAANVKQYVDATNLLYKAADVEAPLQVPTPIEGEAMMQQAMLRVVRALEPYGSAVRAADVQSQFTSMQTKRTAMQSMLRALLPKVIEQSEGLKKEQLQKMNAWLGRLGDAFVSYSTMAQLATLLESSQVEAPVQPQPAAVRDEPVEEGEPVDAGDEPVEEGEPVEGDEDEPMQQEDLTRPPEDFPVAEEKEEVVIPAAKDVTPAAEPSTYRDWLSRQAPKTEGVEKWIALIDREDYYDLSMRNEDEIMQMVELYEPFKADGQLAIITQPYRTFWEFHKEDLKNLDEVINAAATYSKDENARDALKELAAAAKDYIREGVAPKEGGPSTPLPPEGGPSTATGDEGGPSTEQAASESQVGKRVYPTPTKEVSFKLPPSVNVDSPDGYRILKKNDHWAKLQKKSAKEAKFSTAKEMIDEDAVRLIVNVRSPQLDIGLPKDEKDIVEKFTNFFENLKPQKK